MSYYRITNRASGLDIGVYEGTDKAAAIQAMMADADAADQTPSTDLHAYEVDARESMSYAERMTFGGRWPCA